MIAWQHHPRFLPRTEGVTDFTISALEDFHGNGRPICAHDDLEITTRHHRGGRVVEEHDL